MANSAFFYDPRPQFFDDDGSPLVGGFIQSWLAGTTTPQAFFADDTLTTPLPNPITLNAAGRAPTMYAATVAYKVELRRADNSVVWTQDHLLYGNAIDTLTPNDIALAVWNPAVVPVTNRGVNLQQWRGVTPANLHSPSNTVAADVEFWRGGIVSTLTVGGFVKSDVEAWREVAPLPLLAPGAVQSNLVAGSPGTIRQRQFGTMTITNTNTQQTATIVTPLLDINKSRIANLGPISTETAFGNVNAYVEILNTANVRATRAGTSGSTTAAYELIEMFG